MTQVNLESKNISGPQVKESLLPTAVTGYERGLAVGYGTDQYHASLIAAAGAAIIGILEEDAISLKNPCAVIEFGPTIAQVGANVTAGQALAVNASGLLVPAVAGQFVVAIALEPQTYVSPGSFADVFVLGPAGYIFGGSPTFYYTASGALAPVSGTHVLNGAAALAMTLVVPPNDGIDMFIVAQTAHAHTVTTPASGIEGLKHILTYAAEGDSAHICSAFTVWNRKGALTGPTPCALS